ncbi:DUF533 domain-containing protein [Tabrizicola flagellatus]|uniref:DUF533 domain-containing protein n=1 Tax=Tabrizicola flagellatus TaxID=2593021 RepID=UPI001F24019F|nr:DUF533 domain-containing protein [Tabrizicola flagellatus]
MSLGKTLLKVAIGVAIVKGVTSLTQGGTASADTASGRTAGRGTPFDPKSAGKPGGLEDLLQDVLGSGTTSRSSTGRPAGGDGGGLGDLLTQMSGQKRSNPRATAPKGGLEDLLGQLTGGGTAAPTQTASGRGAAPGGVGDLLDQVLADRRPGGPVALPEPKREEELSAALMLRAVIQAVKCDGELDADEKARLMQAMGDATQREVQAVQAELQRPVDVKGLARAVPAGLEPQVYLVSLMAINLDNRAEADYLHKLAGELDLSPDQVNAIHDRAGAPRLYR